LISSTICWSVWKRRNKACFNRKPLTNPIEIITHTGVFLNYWAGLYKEELQEKIAEGVKTLVAAAQWMMARQGPPQPRLMLPAPNETQEGDLEEH
jgi:hypothetical protein